MLDMLFDEEDITMDDMEKMEQIKQRERLKKIKEQIARLTQVLGISYTEDENSLLSYTAGAGMLMLYSTMANLRFDSNNSFLQHSLRCILDHIKSIPDSMMHLGFDITPFLDPDVMVLHHAVDRGLQTKMGLDQRPGATPHHNMPGIQPEPE